MRRYSVVLTPCVLLVAGIVFFPNGLNGPFVFDDLHAIRDHVELRAWSLAQTVQHFRGIVNLTFSIHLWTTGLDVRVFRGTNILIHCLAAMALAGIVRRTLELEPLRERYGQHARPLALIAALLWLVHPLQTESVTLIAQRMESLMGCFYLASLYALNRGARSQKGRYWYVLSLILLCLGLRTKESMCTAPIMLVWYDRTFLVSRWRELLQRRIGYYLGLVSMCLIFAGPLLAETMLRLGPRLSGQFAAITDAAEVPTHAASQTTATNDVTDQTSAHVHDPSATGQHRNQALVVKDLTPLSYLASQPGVILHYLVLTTWPNPLCLDYA